MIDKLQAMLPDVALRPLDDGGITAVGLDHALDRALEESGELGQMMQGLRFEGMSEEDARGLILLALLRERNRIRETMIPA